jgi:hypothetical protein
MYTGSPGGVCQRRQQQPKNEFREEERNAGARVTKLLYKRVAASEQRAEPTAEELEEASQHVLRLCKRRAAHAI